MNSSWKNILLLCSLIFNFILGGFIIYHLVTKPVPPPRHPGIDIERTRYHEKSREISTHRTEFMEHRRRFMENLAAPEFDEERLKGQLDSLLHKQIEMERLIGNNLIEMRRDLTEEEAQRLLRRFHYHMRDKQRVIPRRR